MEALAEAYRELARFDDAEALHREALAIKRRVGDSPASIASSLNDLGLTLSERGRYADAEPLLREAIETWRRLEPDASANVAVGLNNLAQTLRQQGRLDDAAAALDEAIAIRRQRFGNDHPLLAARARATSARCATRRAISPGPSRSCARRWPSAARPTATTIPTRRPRSTTSPRCCTTPAISPGPNRYYRLALASTERRLGPRASRLRRAAEQPGLAARGSGPGRRGRAAVQDLAGRAPRRVRARSPGGGAGAAQPGPRGAGARPRRSSPRRWPSRRSTCAGGSCRPATSRSRASLRPAGRGARPRSGARRRPSSC